MFPIVSEVPVLLLAKSRTAYKLEQATSHDEKSSQDVADFEIRRPRGTPAFYGFLFDEKFRRSVSGIEDTVKGSVVLTVAGGSGIDADFLCRAGSAVIASDISLGSALRSRQRTMRYDLSVLNIVADVEHLPLRNHSVGLAYVHDGLHHLEDPEVGVREMARVARDAISITEPAVAAATSLAVRAGIAEAVESSGNIVRRFTLTELRAIVGGLGFHATAPHRYAMYYRHLPGRLARLMSRQRLAAPSRHLFQLANLLIGRFGNKITIQARRR